MRYLALIFLLYFSHLGNASAQTLPSTSLTTTTLQYNLTSYYPSLNFDITLANPPVDVNGNLPQSVRLELAVHFPNNFGSNEFDLIASNLWSNVGIWTPGTYSATSNTISVVSAPISMYNNSLATANFIVTVPDGYVCPNDTIFYEIRVKYYADSNATSIISWQNNGLVDSVAESEYLGITKLSGIASTQSLTRPICLGDTAHLSLLNLQGWHYRPYADSVQISVAVPTGATFIAYTTLNGFVLSTSSSYTTTQPVGAIRCCIYFPVNYSGSNSFNFSLSVFACAQVYSVVQACTTVVLPCTNPPPPPPPPTPTLNCYVSANWNCLQHETNCQNFVYGSFVKTDTTAFGYYDVNLLVPAKLRASTISIPTNSMGSSYTLTALSTNCAPITGTVAPFSTLSVSNMYNCGSSELMITVRIMESVKTFSHGFGITCTFDSGIALGSQVPFTMYVVDTTGSLVLTKSLTHNAYLCGHTLDNSFIVGNNPFITTVIANPGASVPCFVSLANRGAPPWLKHHDAARISIVAPVNWTFDMAAGLGEKVGSAPNWHIAQQTHPFGTSSNYFVQQGTMSQPYNSSTNGNWLYIDSTYGVGACDYLPYTSNFYYSVKVPYGTPAGDYYVIANLHAQQYIISNTLPIKIIVKPSAQVYSLTRAKCFENTFFDNLAIINDSSNSLRYMGELINTGNVPLTNISIFNSEPKLASGSMQDLQFSNCNYQTRGTDFDCIDYSLNATTPVSTTPIWTSSTNYTHINQPNLAALPYSNVVPIGTTNFAGACNNLTSTIGGASSGSIMINASSNFTLQPLGRIAFYTKPMSHTGGPGDTMYNSFSYVCTRTDISAMPIIVSSTKCTTTVVSDSIVACPACEYVTCNVSCTNAITLTVHNLSNRDVSKVRLVFTGSCIGGTDTLDYAIAGLLAPGQSTIIPSNLLPGFIAPCNVSVSTTLYSRTIEGTDQLLDQCSSGLTVGANFYNTLSHTTSYTANDCYGLANTLSIVASNGGLSPYTYSVNGSTFSNASSFANLAAGTYTTVLKDSIGCMDTMITTILHNKLMHSPKYNASYCHSSSYVLYVDSSTGGAPPYTYSMNGNNFSTLSSFTNLAAGTYTTVLKDSLGCTDTMITTIVQPDSLKFSSIGSHHVSCHGQQTGTFTIALTGGTPSLTSVIQPLGISIGTDTSYSNLTAGTYTITTTDALGCTTSSAITITEPQEVVHFVSADVMKCPKSQNDAIICDSVTGGIAPYQYAINGGLLGNSPCFSGLTNSAIYTLAVKDANTCIVTVSATAYVPDVMTQSTNYSPILCNGYQTAINVSSTGGVSPYTYSINGGNFSTSSSFANLAAGTYTTVLKDSLGCTDTMITTIVQPDSLKFSSIGSHHVSCHGQQTGTFTIALTGGTPSLTSVIQPLGISIGTDTSYSNLTAGTYTITTTDALGCTTSSAITITEPQEIVHFVSADVMKCPKSQNDAIICDSVTGGILPYQYAINGGLLGNSPCFSGLTNSAIYTLAVKDANTCIVTVTATAYVPDVMTQSTNYSPILCNGYQTAINVSSTGGVSPYTYSINGGNFSTSSSFANLAAGTYTTVLKDSLGCADTTITTIVQPDSFLVKSATLQNVLCHGEQTGAFTIVLTGGTPSLTSVIQPLGISIGTDTSYSNLTAGTYTITTTDAVGCTTASSITITEPQEIVHFVSSDVMKCPKSQNDAIICDSVTGGVAPYQYAINGGLLGNSHCFSGLTNSAIYTLAVKDANTCIVTVTATAYVPDVMTQSTNYSPILCNGYQTAINVSSTGGVSPYTYSINGGNFSTSSSFANLAAGTYTTVLKDSLGCADTTITTIVQPDSFLVKSATLQNVLCHGEQTGAFTIGLTGGAPSLTSVIQPLGISIGTDTSYSNLTAGTYTITTTDALGCTTSSAITITEPQPIIHHITAVSSQCANSNAASFCDSVAGGVQPYLYAFNIGSFDTLHCFYGLYNNTNYVVTAKDDNNCTSSTTVFVASGIPAMHIANVDIKHPICAQDSSATIALQTQGGIFLDTNIYYTYSVMSNNNINYATYAHKDSLLLDHLVAGIYTIIVTDANGCTTNTEVTLANSGFFNFYTIQLEPAVCHNTSTAAIHCTASNGFPPYQFSLNNFTNSNTTGIFQNISAGMYTISVSDSLGCIQDSAIILAQATPISFSQLEPKPVSCEGDSDGAIYALANGSAGNFQYTLLPIGSANTTGRFNDLGVGSYNLHVVDKNGCIYDTTIVLGLSAPALAITSSVQHIASCNGATALGTAAVQFNGTGNIPITTAWNTNPIQYDSMAINLSAGIYKANVVDAKGCKASTIVEVIDSLDCCGDAILPTAFTPNNDMLNDKFGVLNGNDLSIRLEAFEIFDRWGNKVYSSVTFGEKWDGTYKGELVELGTYWYYYRYTCSKDSKRYVVKGDVLVVR